jgi:hypothetical protein
MRLGKACRRLIVGSVDGVWVLDRADDGEWSCGGRTMNGTFVSALAWTGSGRLVAGTHHLGLAYSDDEAATWRWSNDGITQFDIWSVKCETLGGREILFAGSMPARLFKSIDGGGIWRDCVALGEVPTAPKWFFPPPPHLGHVKDIAVHRGRELLVGIEVGAFLRSTDEGRTFEEVGVDADFSDIDIHRILVHEDRPDRYILATGWGLKASEDAGATWTRIDAAGINYPDAMVMHPDDPDLLFVSGAQGYPPNWYQINRARPRLARSRDGGRSWERLLGGFPAGQRAAVGAMTLACSPDGDVLFVGDTDGQVWESRDLGDSWFMIAETGALSKGEFHRGLAKGRPRMTDLDSLKFASAGQKRVDTTRA